MDKNNRYEVVTIAERLLRHLPKISAKHAVILSRIAQAELMEIVQRLESLDTPAES